MHSPHHKPLCPTRFSPTAPAGRLAQLPQAVSGGGAAAPPTPAVLPGGGRVAAAQEGEAEWGEASGYESDDEEVGPVPDSQAGGRVARSPTGERVRA